MGFEHFEADDKTIFAVIRGLEIIGEAVKQLPSDVRNINKNIPWTSIAGMRDKLIHAYFGVTLEVVWQTIQHDLDPLENAVRQIIDSTHGNKQR